MARPVTIADETILEAARAVFLERGIRATTAEVAHRAGVSEGIVFKRFHTKERLFQRAMRFDGSPDETPWIAKLPSRVGQGEVRANLEEMCLEALDFLRGLVPFVMMSWSNPEATSAPKMAHPTGPEGPPPVIAARRLASYFEAEMRLGRIRRQDTEVLAHTLIGALFHHATMEVLAEDISAMLLPAPTFVRGLVGLMWTGLEPVDSTSPPPHPSRRVPPRPAR